jgi:adenosylmethionine-8-amino-7-oxononanoate aminotransferase
MNQNGKENEALDPQTKQSLMDKDRRYVWHPFTQMKDYENRDHVLIEKAEGIFLYDADGNRYYDTNSSWWVNVHGHSHPRIRQAINNQLEKIDHVMFSGLTHQPGIELAEKLAEITPAGLNRVFYSDNGSTAVEVALKMSYQYWKHVGQEKKNKYIYLENSYHGDTIGAVSVGGVELFHGMFRPLLFPAYRVPAPQIHDWQGIGIERSVASVADAVTDALQALREVLEQHAEEIAAMIIEPLILAAGGMVVYPTEYLKGVRELCTQYNVHLIADEVATGFGRTGRMFACEHAGISPDLMCLSKGLTAGVMPLSATLCTDEIYNAFYDDYETLKTFFHGHSFTGNPLACAVALESLRLFEENKLMEHVGRASATLREHMSRFRSYPHVGNIRHLGMIAAFNLYEDAENRKPFEFSRRTGFQVYMEGFRHGLMLRPLGDTIYYWLPLITTEQQIEDIVDRTQEVLMKLGL